MEAFEDLFRTWGNAACAAWGYPSVTDDWLAMAMRRLPAGLGGAVARGVASGQVIVVDGHRFRLHGVDAHKGPYAFFSRSADGAPAPNWEYFVQVAEYLRLRVGLDGRGLRVALEDDLMDLAAYSEDGLLWCIEVKEQAASTRAAH